MVLLLCEWSKQPTARQTNQTCFNNYIFLAHRKCKGFFIDVPEECFGAFCPSSNKHTIHCSVVAKSTVWTLSNTTPRCTEQLGRYFLSSKSIIARKWHILMIKQANSNICNLMQQKQTNDKTFYLYMYLK